MELLALLLGTRGEADFVLDFFVARWAIWYDPSAGRFLELDEAEVNPETVVGVGNGLEMLDPFRPGGGAWFEIGSIPIPHLSYS